MPDLSEAAREGGGMALLVASGGLLKWAVDAWLKTRRTPEQKAADAAGLDAQSVKIAGGLMHGMREDLDALRDEMREMKDQHRREMDAARNREDACERRCDALAGELRQARQEMSSLIRQLRDPSSTAPGGVLEGAVIQLTSGRADVVSTTQARKIK